MSQTATVNNISNGPIFVAVGSAHGAAISEGWNLVPANQSKNFFGLSSDGDFLLRIVGSDGSEITFPGHPDEINLPVFNDLTVFFSVNRQLADPSVINFSTPSTVPPFSENQFQNDPLPAGWSAVPFFNTGPGNTTWNIEPPA